MSLWDTYSCIDSNKLLTLTLFTPIETRATMRTSNTNVHLDLFGQSNQCRDMPHVYRCSTYVLQLCTDRFKELIPRRDALQSTCRIDRETLAASRLVAAGCMSFSHLDTPTNQPLYQKYRASKSPRLHRRGR
jgi:hypothetical protein